MAEIGLTTDPIRASGQLHMFANTPIWGAAYYDGARKLQQRLFG